MRRLRGIQGKALSPAIEACEHGLRTLDYTPAQADIWREWESAKQDHRGRLPLWKSQITGILSQ